MSGLALSLTVCGRGRSGLRGADLIHVKSYTQFDSVVRAGLTYGGQTSHMSSLVLSLTVYGRGRSDLWGADLIHVKSCTQFDNVW